MVAPVPVFVLARSLRVSPFLPLVCPESGQRPYPLHGISRYMVEGTIWIGLRDAHTASAIAQVDDRSFRWALALSALTHCTGRWIELVRDRWNSRGRWRRPRG